MRLGRYMQPSLSRLQSRLLSTFASTRSYSKTDNSAVYGAGRGHGSEERTGIYEIHGVKGPGGVSNQFTRGSSNGEVRDGIEMTYDIKVETRPNPMETEIV